MWFWRQSERGSACEAPHHVHAAWVFPLPAALPPTRRIHPRPLYMLRRHKRTDLARFCGRGEEAHLATASLRHTGDQHLPQTNRPLRQSVATEREGPAAPWRQHGWRHGLVHRHGHRAGSRAPWLGQKDQRSFWLTLATRHSDFSKLRLHRACCEVYGSRKGTVQMTGMISCT